MRTRACCSGTVVVGMCFVLETILGRRRMEDLLDLCVASCFENIFHSIGASCFENIFVMSDSSF